MSNLRAGNAPRESGDETIREIENGARRHRIIWRRELGPDETAILAYVNAGRSRGLQPMDRSIRSRIFVAVAQVAVIGEMAQLESPACADCWRANEIDAVGWCV